MGYKKIYQLPEEPFNGTVVNNCFYVEFENQRHLLNPLKRVRLNKILEWIKEECKKDGLTIKLIKDNEQEQIIFVK